ncbi:MAG: Asp-tRNA(Asn)/Glu-tRNA(Gln) amidotransferase subunit GatA [Candidatus Latescibacteria bacterium]|nr:Asp-tRNA(Asn)/Glu-tRNA(Gln) amidotransferase subunit GatA [Candidatus Latescibacterota bacterium]
MRNEDLVCLIAREIVRTIKNREISAREVIEASLSRIEEKDREINAFIAIDQEGALRQAESIDRRIRAGEDVGPLAGVPIGIKDGICTEGLRTTAASRILGSFTPPYDATVIQKLRASGAIIVGKTNMDEFGMGSSTENSAFEVTRNPHDVTRVAGGSSGGSASALAAGEVPLALGEDTGGSIRQPASFCGVVGMKPTYGRVSRYGIIAYASSLDQVGPMARNVQDTALLLRVIAGYDPNDSTSAPVEVPDYVSECVRAMTGIRIGLPREYFTEGVDREVQEAVMRCATILEEEGAEIVEVSLPHAEYGIAAYYIVATAEASANLARYDGVKYGYRSAHVHDLFEMYSRTRGEGFGREVKRRIMLGTYALSAGYYDAYYVKAQKVRTLIKRDFEEALKTCDVLLTPVTPTPAFRIGEKIDDPLQMYLADIYTISANLAGVPGLSVPCGWSSLRLPIGAQVMGRPFEESLVFRVGYAIEQKMQHAK